MKNFQEPTRDDIRRILIEARYFEWPTFDHMPLNCFDLTSAVFTFPGDICESRVHENSGYVNYKIDISDLETCPRKDEVFDIELWNEKSVLVSWFFGRMEWSCLVDAGDFVLNKGFFAAGVAVARFQNVPGVDDLTDLKQLKRALFFWLQEYSQSGSFVPIPEDAIYTKVINGRSWLIARSLDQLGDPAYKAVSPIDAQTSIFIPSGIHNGWFLNEDVPEDIEQKYLASFWDFLGHIHVTHTPDGDVKAGTTIRQAPGQAERIDLPEW